MQVAKVNGRTVVQVSSLTDLGGTTPDGDDAWTNSPLDATAIGSNAVLSISANGSNVLMNPFVNFASGSGITLSTSSNTMTITSTGGASGDFLTKIEGGQDTISAHGDMGATETFDPTDGNVHTGRLDADCTVTLNAPVGSGAATLELYLTNDTGSRTVTWPGSVVWSGGSAPTLGSGGAGSLDRIILETLDGGTTWYGVIIGGSSVGSLDDLSDVTITTPAENDTLRYISGEWVNDNRRWEPVTDNPGGGPELVWDGDDLVMEWKEY